MVNITEVSEDDFSYFRDQLVETTRRVFTTVQQENPEEHFYAFGLLHEPLWLHILAIANSEEGLVRRANEIKLDKHNTGYYSQLPMQQLMDELRWTSGDWDYIDVGLEAFQSLNEWMDEKAFRWAYEHDKAGLDAFKERMISICKNVLQQLDREGLFGTGEARKQVMINIMMGDQDPSWVRYGEALNPPEAYQRWLDEVGRWY